MEKSQQTCELLAQAHPRDTAPHALLLGVIYPITAKYHQAMEESDKVIALDPAFVVGYWNRRTAINISAAWGRLRRASGLFWADRGQPGD